MIEERYASRAKKKLIIYRRRNGLRGGETERELSSGRQSIRSHQQWMSTFGWEKDVWEMEDIDGKGGGDWDWGSWSEEEEKWPDANFAAVHIHKTIRYPIVIVVDYQYIRCRRETPLSMARRDSHDYRIPPSWPNIFGHTDTLLYYSVLSFRLIDKSSRFWWLLPSSCLVDFLWYWLRMPTYTYKSPPRHSWEKFRQVPAVATLV